MAYTVKQVAEMSGVSVRTLHFYDETGLLKPAYTGANGYRFYEEPQLLMLQQILFYRELGFELKAVKRILGGRKFEKAAALQSHREVLEKDAARTHALIATIDKTIEHLEGTKKMKSEEMFAGFSVAAGRDRFGDQIRLGGEAGEPIDCKVSGKDTGGAMCIFEWHSRSAGPKHLHHDQDEWIYIIEGEFDFEIGEKRFHAGPGECIFLPRRVPHVWASSESAPAPLFVKPGKIINTYQPAGKMEDFFREIAKYNTNGLPQFHEALTIDQMAALFQAHGMDLLGPPMLGQWEINDQGYGVFAGEGKPN